MSEVNHPEHYTSHPSGIECITIVEHFNFNIGNAIKYLWRAGLKGEANADLAKAVWYVQRELERRNPSKIVDLPPITVRAPTVCLGCGRANGLHDVHCSWRNEVRTTSSLSPD